jgi:hypothetical protein
LTSIDKSLPRLQAGGVKLLTPDLKLYERRNLEVSIWALDLSTRNPPVSNGKLERSISSFLWHVILEVVLLQKILFKLTQVATRATIDAIVELDRAIVKFFI